MKTFLFWVDDVKDGKSKTVEGQDDAIVLYDPVLVVFFLFFFFTAIYSLAEADVSGLSSPVVARMGLGFRCKSDRNSINHVAYGMLPSSESVTIGNMIRNRVDGVQHSHRRQPSIHHSSIYHPSTSKLQTNTSKYFPPFPSSKDTLGHQLGSRV